MRQTLTFSEKRLVNQVLAESRLGHNPVGGWTPEAGMFLLGVGGFLLVAVCLVTLNNLNAVTIRYLLVPGCIMGLVTAMLGAWGMHVAEMQEERRVLARLLKKLI